MDQEQNLEEQYLSCSPKFRFWTMCPILSEFDMNDVPFKVNANNIIFSIL
jgi:hypothetical protein